jgi:hypothetical protein
MKPHSLLALALCACGSPFSGEVFEDAGHDSGPDASLPEASTEGGPGEAGVDSSPDVEPDAACACEHMPYIGSGDSCGPSFSCASVGENTCWRCPCEAPADFWSTCLKVGDDGAHVWWCCP